MRTLRLNVRQVAARLGLSVSAARRLIVYGDLDGLRINGRLFVTGAALASWLERHR